MNYRDVFTLEDKIKRLDKTIYDFAVKCSAYTSGMKCFNRIIDKIIYRQHLLIRYRKVKDAFEQLDDLSKKILTYLYKYHLSAVEVARELDINIRTLWRKLEKLGGKKC